MLNLVHMPTTRSHRNTHTPDEHQHSSQPFFSLAEKTMIQQKAEPFFPGHASGIQPKLTIGQPGDKYEREADAVAETVVNRGKAPTTTQGPAGVQRLPITPVGSGRLQRLATPDEEKMPSTNDQRMEEDKAIQEKPDLQRMEAPEEELQTKPEEEEPVQMMEAPKEEETAVQAKATGTETATPNLSSRIDSSKGKGKALPKKTRTEMESGIGADFRSVGIHTDSEAVHMNRELGAQAFTTGKDIYFNQGKYNPNSTEGKRLLAHELTHVVQQRSTPKKPEVQMKQVGGLNTSPTPHFVYELDSTIHTFSGLGKHYGLSSSAIQNANTGVKANALKIGDKLTIPASNPPTAAFPMAGLTKKIVMDTGTVPLVFRWNSGASDNWIGRIARGTTVSESGGRVVALLSDLSGIADGILEYLKSVGAADSKIVAGYLSAQNLRDAQHTYTTTEIDLIARMIWGEQRSQGKDAMAGAAWIVKNRFNAGWGSIANIVTTGQFHGLVGADAVKGLSGPDLQAWTDAQQISKDVLNGTIADNTNGHIYFGNGDSVRKRMEACQKSNSNFIYGNITGSDFYHSNGDFTSNCQIR